MADYWKSLDKKFCDICKCWLADNKASIDFHENGKRHKENVQKRLKEIQKKNKQEDKKERKLEYDMKKIENAAKAAMKKDMEDNPDMSMKLQAYYEKTQTVSVNEDDGDKASSSSSGPKISHRSEKEKKADEAKLAQMHKPAVPYNRSGGWQTVQNRRDGVDLELPSSTTPHQFVAKQAEKRKPEYKFEEKSVSSLTSSSSSSISSGFMPIKTEPVSFKKRRTDRGNMRKRDDD